MYGAPSMVFPLRHGIAILMGSATSQRVFDPFFGGNMWQKIALATFGSYGINIKRWCFFWGVVHSGGTLPSKQATFPPWSNFWALRINAAEMPQCKISFTSRWWKNGLQKFLHCSGSPKKRQRNVDMTIGFLSKIHGITKKNIHESPAASCHVWLWK